MRLNLGGWNVILAGFWNRLIFTPEWVSERIFHHKAIETYVALLPVLPIVFSDKTVSMEASLARLVFRPADSARDALARAESMAREVLRALPETPVQAVGVNFSYVEDFPPDHLTSIFSDKDPTDLRTMGWEIQERKLTRQLTRGDDTLNLTMTYDGKAVTFDLNFHSEATTNDAAQKAVRDGRVVALKNLGLEVLQVIYRLKLEEDGDDYSV